MPIVGTFEFARRLGGTPVAQDRSPSVPVIRSANSSEKAGCETAAIPFSRRMPDSAKELQATARLTCIGKV
jgi:hypothetical protein